jgi:transposase InsO family protein
LKLRIDNGTQYTSDYFLQQLNYLGVEPSFGLVRQPQTNGVAERFHRTLKEQILEGRSFKNADEVREAVRNFIEVYNSRWMVAKRDYQSPMEARRNYDRLKGAA